LNADRPEVHLGLALLFAKQRKFAAAAAELKTALELDPTFVPAAVNLADLDRELGRDAEAETVLRQGLQRSPNDASLLHALGLAMVREKRKAQALDLLAKAARLDPGSARYAYVYAIALNDSGQTKAAIETLERSIKLHPYDRDSLAALAAFMEQVGDSIGAQTYRQRLDQLTAPNQ
jgi:tetratricopeptide (TPR) repeat protein